MRESFPLLFQTGRSLCSRQWSRHENRLPLVVIENGTFYRNHRGLREDPASNPPIFPNLTFSLRVFPKSRRCWAIVDQSASGKTTLLEILQGQHFCSPPQARSFPFLLPSSPLAENQRSVSRAKKRHSYSAARSIQYVGFNEESGGPGGSGARGAYLSARYESRHEDTDYSVMDYLKGTTQLNDMDSQDRYMLDPMQAGKVIEDLQLKDLVHMPLRNLSNGQIRRARIARALLAKPRLLLLDEPFMGLDPEAVALISQLLRPMALDNAPCMVFAFRRQDQLPSWVTHLVQLGPNQEISYFDRRKRLYGIQPGHNISESPDLQVTEDALPEKDMSFGDTVSSALPPPELQMKEQPENLSPDFEHLSRDGLPLLDKERPGVGQPLVEMRGVNVKYGNKQILGACQQEVDGEMRDGLWWTIRRGQRWGVFGPNGCGKTTLLSLICSDHPQTYSLPLLLFGQSRLPTPGSPGISIFALQSRIGHSSPEIHAFFPKHLSLRRVLENAWAETFLGTPKLTYDCDARVDACLRWFEAELNPKPSETAALITMPLPSTAVAPYKPQRRPALLEMQSDTDWADTLRFGDLPFSAQRIALFLRAIIKSPDLVILDEAFSGMDEPVRDKCMTFLTWGHTKVWGVRRVKNKARMLLDSKVVKVGKAVMTGLEERQALLCVSHVREEVPGVVREWMKLPGDGGEVRWGRMTGPLEGRKEVWEEIWCGGK